MNTYQKNTAVLYFTRSADEEAHAKSFCGSANFAQNRAIAQKLINHTYKQIRGSRLPLRVFGSGMQQGSSFGEKLANAFQSLFDEGFENVIAVGNDCIQLSPDTLQHAAGLLSEKPVVAGPTTDGGTYLIGINRRAFHKKAFTNLAWQTDNLLRGFNRYAQTYGYTLTNLGLSVDIDNEDALRQLLRDVSFFASYTRLVILIQSIFSSRAYFYQKRKLSFFSLYLQSCLYHRGPPLR